MKEVNQEQLIKDISERIKKIRSYTPKVGVFGNSGVGKSSLCNALFGKDVAKISDVKACTRKPQEILIGSADGEGGIVLVDVPGIGEDPKHQEEYTELYKSLVPELDLILWAIKADDRNYASGLDAYAAIFSGKKETPVIFVITQTDKTNDSEDWEHEKYSPGESQLKNIAVKENDVSRRFKTPASNIVSIAVSKKENPIIWHHWLNLLWRRSQTKKYSFTREAKEENVSQQARKSAEKGIWDSAKEMAGEAWDAVKDKVVDALITSAPKIISTVGRWIKNWF